MQQAQTSVANLTQAARAIVTAQQRQAQAQAAALAVPSMVPNGLGLGGLQPVAGRDRRVGGMAGGEPADPGRSGWPGPW